MLDGESLELTHFGINELPNQLEKRTKTLLDNLEDKMWDLGSSFSKESL